MANQSNSFGVEYIVKRAVESNDVNSIANEMENKGYTVYMKTSDGMMVSKSVAGFGTVNVMITINQASQDITVVISTPST